MTNDFKLIWNFYRRHYIVGTLVLIAVLAYMPICINRGNDFITYYELGRQSLHHSGNLYVSTTSTGMTVAYMPYFFLFMIPWALLPFKLAAGLWYILKFALLFLLLAKFWTWSGSLPQRTRILSVVLPLIVCINYLNNDLRVGQSNLIIHALIIFSFLALLSGKNIISALLFVLSSFKFTPLILLPYFLIHRKWKFLLAVAGWVGVLSILFIFWFGWSEALATPGRWVELVKSRKLNLLEMAEIRNQSLTGAVSRFATEIKEGPGGNHTVEVEKGGMASNTLINVTSIANLGLIVFIILLAFTRRKKPMDLAHLSLFLALMLIVSPDTRSAHMVHLLLPAFILIISQDWGKFSFKRYWWVIIVGIAFLFNSRDFVGMTVYFYSLYFSMQFVVLLIFFILLSRHSAEQKDQTNVRGVYVSS